MNKASFKSKFQNLQMKQGNMLGIDEENITNEQKRSMNIWMHILNTNLKKISFQKFSLNSLENYDYENVQFFQ